MCFTVYELSSPRLDLVSDSVAADDGSGESEPHETDIRRTVADEGTGVAGSTPCERSDVRGRRLVGLTRWITDHVSVVYLNDVYILPEYRGRGLAKWVLSCVDEVFSEMQWCRGMILIVNKGSNEERLYRQYLGMHNLEGDAILLDRKGRGTTTAGDAPSHGMDAETR